MLCDLPPGERAHGTHARAQQGCPCERCQAARAARREYNRRRRQAIARPDSVWIPYVSAQPAREHLAALSAAGMGLRTVARLSGVSHGALSKIVYGEPGLGRAPSARIRPDAHRRILAVRVSHAGGGQRVQAADTWRLIDELVAAGYSRSFLARALGSRAGRPTLQIGRTRVRASTARSVEDLHRRLMSRPPPRTR
jgi:hypothetical protein